MIPGFKATESSNVRLLERVYIDQTVNAAGVGVAVQVSPNRPVSAILCSVRQGAIDLFLGSAGRRVPDFHFGQTNRPEWVPIPCGTYEFSLVPTGVANQLVQACLWFGGPDE